MSIKNNNIINVLLSVTVEVRNPVPFNRPIDQQQQPPMQQQHQQQEPRIAVPIQQIPITQPQEVAPVPTATPTTAPQLKGTILYLTTNYTVIYKCRFQE